MPFLLDTNAWIHYLKDSQSPMRARLQVLPSDEIRLCSIVKAELLHGAQRYGNRERRLLVLKELFAPFESLVFDDLAAEYYGPMRFQLEAGGQALGPMDLQIAAICLANDLTLVSHDAAFAHVSGLKLVDWHI